MIIQESFKKWRCKRIAIWGLGREGRSVARILNLYEIPFFVLNDSQIKNDVNAIDIFSGEDVYSKLETFDIIIKSPGISIYKKEIQRILKKLVFTSTTNVWLEFFRPNSKIIFVTGTKGKSTTVSLLSHILKEYGIQTILAGNIGYPVLDFIEKKADIWIVELSSYQIADLKHNGDIHVLLNLYPEHIDWHGSQQQYFKDKSNLIHLQQSGYNVVHQNLSNLFPSKKIHTFCNTNVFNCNIQGIYNWEKKLLSSKDIPLKGQHNYENICAILTVIDLLGIPIQKILPHITTFSPLPYRLQNICTKNQKTYICDSISTTPESTLAAIGAFPGEEITLLVGGQDRGLNWEKFACNLHKLKVKNVITMYESGKHIYQYLKEKIDSLHYCKNMEEAICLANQISSTGIILLSPAAPSYDFFSNFEKKGNIFIQFVENL